MKIKTTLEIDAPASAVWEIFGEQFEDVSNWADSITKSTLDGQLGDGAVRTCDIKAFGPVAAGQVTEEITYFNRETYSLTYALRSGIPGMMNSIENAWTIESLDNNNCKVTSRANFRMKWWALPLSPLMRIPLTRAVKDFTNQLKKAVINKKLNK